ncbi:WD40-repeat-containing domain protein [Lactifluus subvellereus]|nr:WD40-repeat-containing domain protein [Lactifluus subvellereus]
MSYFVRFSPDGSDTHFAVGPSTASFPTAHDNLDAPTQKRNYIRAVAICFDGDLFAAGSEDKLMIWDTRILRLLHTFAESSPGSLCPRICPRTAAPERTGICALAMSPKGRHVACALNGMIRVWDLGGGGILKTAWTAHTRAVYSARFILQGVGLVTASLDRTLERWGLSSSDGGCVQTLEKHKIIDLTLDLVKDYVLACATAQEGQML